MTRIGELLDRSPDLLLPVDFIELDIPDDVFAPDVDPADPAGWSECEIADHDSPVESPEDEMERARRLPLGIVRGEKA
jgi:hypothetical protein